MKISPDSLRAARALINISQQELAERIGISRPKVSRYEDKKTTEQGKPVSLSQKNLENIFSYFQSRGVRFTDYGGVEWIPENEVRTLSGVLGFKSLMDDVYAFAKDEGGTIEILNGTPDLFIKWLGQSWYDMHAQRMLAVKDNIHFRILVGQDEQQFIATGFAEYRRVPNELFNTQTVYIYGAHVAVFSFYEDDLDIKVFKANGLIQSLRLLFDMCWEKAE